MANGHYESRHTRRIGKRKLSLVLSLVLLMAMAIGGTMAFLITRSDNVANSFAPGHVGCVVTNNGDEWTVKPDKDTNAKVYLRAEVVANYAKTDAKGTIHWSQPTLKLENVYSEPEDENIFGVWSLKDDGYYYFSDAVAPNQKDFVRKFKITTTGTAPTGYEVQIQVLGEAIQAGPAQVNWNKDGMNNQ